MTLHHFTQNEEEEAISECSFGRLFQQCPNESKRHPKDLSNRHLFPTFPTAKTFSPPKFVYETQRKGKKNRKCAIALFSLVLFLPNQTGNGEEKVLRGVQKRKPTKRSKKKLLKKVVDYLRSDSYMFAPLISSQSRTLRSSAESNYLFFFFFTLFDYIFGFYFNVLLVGSGSERTHQRKQQQKVNREDWGVKSDTYMYAPLVDPPRSISPLPTGSSWYMKRVTTAVSTQNITFQDNEPTDWSSEIVGKDQTSKSFLQETSI
ncbi:hypothetical protein I3760_07G183800 [Carya illinoinensis]|nr:hypothetical protein I3760_07G183800 [Carya illinoinensis]